MPVSLRVGLVAGEASGDTLGADLIAALRERAPGSKFFGVAGPKMQAAGCELTRTTSASGDTRTITGPYGNTYAIDHDTTIAFQSGQA